MSIYFIVRTEKKMRGWSIIYICRECTLTMAGIPARCTAREKLLIKRNLCRENSLPQYICIHLLKGIHTVAAVYRIGRFWKIHFHYTTWREHNRSIGIYLSSFFLFLLKIKLFHRVLVFVYVNRIEFAQSLRSFHKFFEKDRSELGTICIRGLRIMVSL